MSGKQKGFTLIELVMVIVVLGILAAVAIPRFFDISTSAQNASVDGMESVVGSAIAIAMARKASGATPDYDPPTGTQVANEAPGTGCVVDSSDIYINSAGSAYGTADTIDIQLLDDTGASIAACSAESVAQLGTAVWN